jgi:hypothetical protein
MTSEEFQTRVARLALSVAREHGFALGGGHAFIAHGLVSRPTEDVDLFSDADGAVQRAAQKVAAALTAVGLTVELVPETSELGELFYGFGEDMVEFEVREGADVVRLQLARFDRTRAPVVMDVGPVLHVDDVIGGKVVAMATRAEPRDYIDVAAVLGRYSPQQLMSLARQADPALTDEDFADALRRLDRLDNAVFEELYGRTREQIDEIRARFAGWPRT